jgi:hypothetical protein
VVEMKKQVERHEDGFVVGEKKRETDPEDGSFGVKKENKD